MSASMWREITKVSLTVHQRQVHSHCSKLTKGVIKVGIKCLSSNMLSDQTSNFGSTI